MRQPQLRKACYDGPYFCARGRGPGHLRQQKEYAGRTRNTQWETNLHQAPKKAALSMWCVLDHHQGRATRFAADTDTLQYRNPISVIGAHMPICS
jgi:hypothetical protein